MPIRHKHMQGTDKRRAAWLDRRPAMVLSEAARQALAGFLAQASFPSSAENAQCPPAPSASIH